MVRPDPGDIGPPHALGCDQARSESTPEPVGEVLLDL
jgi:hypothetical protein